MKPPHRLTRSGVSLTVRFPSPQKSSACTPIQQPLKMGTLLASDSVASLLDVMQAVPQLLLTVASICGVKQLRLLSVPARSLAVRAIRGFCLKLFPNKQACENTEESGTIPQVTTLLRHARLQQLSIEVINPEGLINAPNELSVQQDQLRAFSKELVACLLTVNSLVIKFKDSSDDTSLTTSISGCSINDGETRIPSKPDRVWIASLLTAACPNVQHLQVGGGLGPEGMRLCGAKWPKLASLKILNNTFPEGLFKGMLLENMLQQVTHLTLVNTEPRAEPNVPEFELWRCPALTDLYLGKGWLLLHKDLHMLPLYLKVLKLSKLPRFPANPLPSRVRFEQLHSIIMPSYSFDLEELAYLLRLAPSLKALGLIEMRGNSIVIQDTCLEQDLEHLQYLGQRMLGGLNVNGAFVRCCRTISITERHFPMKELLSRLPKFSTFESCTINLLMCEADKPRTECNCLLELAQAFPCLKTLVLSGLWTDKDLSEIVKFDCVKNLRLGCAALSAATILNVVACMPKLVQLSLDFMIEGLEQSKFTEMLKATQHIHVGDGAGTLKHQWGQKMITKSDGESYSAVWVREDKSA